MTPAKVFFCVCALMSAMCSAQTPPAADTPTPEPPILQIRKAVTFIQLKCKNGNQEFDVKGTGFFISYPDPRLGKDGQFVYLVTNRHVALCWNEEGKAMEVESISIRLNRRQNDLQGVSQDNFLNMKGNVTWVLPSDNSVDLAALPLLPDQSLFDFKIVPFSILATTDFLKQRNVTVGEPVLFAGFFYQFPGVKRMEPIVRQGIIAMMPEDPLPFVGLTTKVYLADMHVFGGNSGSPVFINVGGLRGNTLMPADDYHLLGVVNGELSEDENFNLELTGTIKGTARANSGVSTIVPADAVKALLEQPQLQAFRDAEIKVRGLQK